MLKKSVAGPGLRPGKSNAASPSLIPSRIHLAPVRVSGPAVAVLAGIAILSHEIRNHAVKAGIAKVSRPRQRKKIPDRDGSIRPEKLEANRSACSNDRRIHGLADVGRHDDPSHDAFVPRDRPRHWGDRAPLGPDRNPLPRRTLEWIRRHRHLREVRQPAGIERGTVLFPEPADVLKRRDSRIIGGIAGGLIVARKNR